MPRAKPETITLIIEHVRRTLDLILFSGHKALLTSQMHLSSVRESYRELEEKNGKLQEAFDRLQRARSPEVELLGRHLARASDAAHLDHRLQRDARRGHRRSAWPAIRQKFVETIHEKGEQLLQLIMSLLDLSKLESGTLSLRKANVQHPAAALRGGVHRRAQGAQEIHRGRVRTSTAICRPCRATPNASGRCSSTSPTTPSSSLPRRAPCALSASMAEFGAAGDRRRLQRARAVASHDRGSRHRFRHRHAGRRARAHFRSVLPSRLVVDAASTRAPASAFRSSSAWSTPTAAG